MIFFFPHPFFLFVDFGMVLIIRISMQEPCEVNAAVIINPVAAASLKDSKSCYIRYLRAAVYIAYAMPLLSISGSKGFEIQQKNA